MSRLRQNGYKKCSSIILSLPAVSLLDKSLLQDTVLTQLAGFLHCSHCALSSLAPRKFLSVSRECMAACAPFLRLSEPRRCCGISSFFAPSFHLPHPACLPPPSHWPPEGSAPHCHEYRILTGNKWIKQIMSGTGIQCGENTFPGGP